MLIYDTSHHLTSLAIVSVKGNIFYDPDYLSVQEHDDLFIHENDDFKIVLSLNRQKAVSLPMGLFGSFEKKKRTASFSSFQDFWDELKSEI